MTSQLPPVTTCAIYTRKSTQIGLDRDFTSLDNQHAVCSAYIASQQHKGWSPVSTRYDDAGFSGGTADRPALQRLLRDIEHGHVKTIVIYKIDRLTRSLADFVRMMEVFERHQVSFVSVTQAFDTSDSMGRLVLNILLTFAQFEREMLADRIRDKIAAMRRRGMHIGGPPPYGYDVVNGRLVVNEVEAAKVRSIFERHLALGSYQRLREELRDEGMLTKVWRTRKGTLRGGTPVSSGMIYRLLRNPVYWGKVVYRGTLYDGEHEAIVSDESWAAVNALCDLRVRRRSRRGPSPNLLLGLLIDWYGRRMIMRVQRRGQRRFRYYTSEPPAQSHKARVRTVRTPAEELEQLVQAAIRDFLRDPRRVREAILATGRPSETLEALVARGPAAAGLLEGADLAQRRDLLVALIAHGRIAQDKVTLAVRCHEVARLLEWDGRDRFDARSCRWQPEDPAVTVELRVRVADGRQILVLPLEARRGPASPVNPALVRLIHQARKARGMVDAEREVPLAELGRRFHWQSGYFARVLRQLPSAGHHCSNS